MHISEIIFVFVFPCVFVFLSGLFQVVLNVKREAADSETKPQNIESSVT